MSERLRESLSALMDGEADELELRRLLAQQDEGELRADWQRYHLAQRARNDDLSAFENWDISQSVSAAIADENIELLPLEASSEGFSFWRPVAGFAVAASVAVAMVVGVNAVNQSDPAMSPVAPTVASRVYPASGSSGLGNVAVNAHYSSEAPLPGTNAAVDQAAQQRLQKYMLRHTEAAATNSSQGMISFARVANFETE